MIISEFTKGLLKAASEQGAPILIERPDNLIVTEYVRIMLGYNPEREMIDNRVDLLTITPEIKNNSIVIVNKNESKVLHNYLTTYVKITIYPSELGGTDHITVKTCERKVKELPKIYLKKSEHIKLVSTKEHTRGEYKYLRDDGINMAQHVVEHSYELASVVSLLKELIEIARSNVYKKYATSFKYNTAFIFKLDKLRYGSNVRDEVMHELVTVIRMSKYIAQSGIIIAVEGDPQMEAFKELSRKH